MNKSDVCKRLLYIDPVTKKRVYKDKKKYKSPEGALRAMRSMNNSGTQFHKVEAYKCTSCLWFHVGKTNKKLKST